MQSNFMALSIFCMLFLSACSQPTAEPQDFPTRQISSPTAAAPTQTLAAQASATETAQPPAATNPAGQKLQVITSEDTVNVRSGPGTFYPVVAKVHSNDVLQAVGVDTSATWVQFKDTQAPDGVAWIFAAFTNFDRAASQLPEITNLPTPPVTPTAAPPRAMGSIHAANPGAQVNVRSGPGTDFPLVGKVNDGDILKATGVTDSGDWVQIQFSGSGVVNGTAWVYTSYTDYDPASRTLPLVTDLPSTPTPAR